eukprot:Rhum_TRINITY_DN4630_c0_g1::Rhum_TRINITY_DN4630_c0_g1_i1::g.15145::m.15145
MGFLARNDTRGTTDSVPPTAVSQLLFVSHVARVGHHRVVHHRTVVPHVAHAQRRHERQEHHPEPTHHRDAPHREGVVGRSCRELRGRRRRCFKPWRVRGSRARDHDDRPVWQHGRSLVRRLLLPQAHRLDGQSSRHSELQSKHRCGARCLPRIRRCGRHRCGCGRDDRACDSLGCERRRLGVDVGVGGVGGGVAGVVRARGCREQPAVRVHHDSGARDGVVAAAVGDQRGAQRVLKRRTRQDSAPHACGGRRSRRRRPSPNEGALHSRHPLSDPLQKTRLRPHNLARRLRHTNFEPLLLLNPVSRVHLPHRCARVVSLKQRNAARALRRPCGPVLAALPHLQRRRPPVRHPHEPAHPRPRRRLRRKRVLHTRQPRAHLRGALQGNPQ